MHSIQLQHLSLQYGEQTVLQDINLDVEAGDFICLIGPSGSGKSSLLRLVAGLSRPTAGSVSIDGTAVTKPGLDRGVVFQEYSLFPWMSVGSNIRLGLEQAFPGQSKRALRQKAEHFLELVGLHGVYDKMPAQLSGGMRQRAAIARAFAMDPPILLMDEPFGALDAVTRAHLQDLVSQLWQSRGDKRKTVIFVTHDVDEALLLATKIVVLTLNPGTVRDIIPVSFYNRRQSRENLYKDPDFINLRTQLVYLLNEQIIHDAQARAGH